MDQAIEKPGERTRSTSSTAHLFGGGEMGERIRDFDWSRTPLGPAETWPQSLKTAVQIMLNSRQPIWLGWGEQLIKLYNDPYKAIVGGKHPAALGQPAAVVWHEIWDAIGPMLTTAMGGVEGTYVEEQLLIMERNGYPEETYYTFSYSAIRDDAGEVGGIICANTDDTRRVVGERQLSLLRELAAKTADARTVADACALSTGGLATNPFDLPFALLYLADADAQRVVLAGKVGNIERGQAAAPETAALDDTAIWPFAEVLAHNQARLIPDLPTLGHALPTGAWDRPPSQAVAIPIASQGRTGTAGILVVGLNPYRLFDDTYRGFLELVAAQIASSIANAQAYEEERKRAEALAELDQAKTAFFSNVSHEFRTPLTLMLAPLEDALAEAADLPPASRERLEVAHRNALRLLKLVNTLLDFSRIEAGRTVAAYEPTDLATFTAELASVFRSAIERAGLRLNIDCPPLAAPASIDRAMWEKIVFNLLSNAFKFTFAGEIAVALRQRDDMAELSVRDTGTGIPADQLPHLFERFHRVDGARGRTFEGSGIGLALVQELATLHGGAVRVESALGKGSTFVVAIPLAQTQHAPGQPSAAPTRAPASAIGAAYLEEALRWLPAESAEFETLPAAPGAQAAARILLADDNADMRDYVRRLLAHTYEVVTVGDGVAALKAAQAAPFDLVLTDVMMPELDGFGLLRELRADERLKTIPVILLSARAGEEARIEGMEAGADDYMIKPFSARELQARVSARLELARMRAQIAEDQAALANLFNQSPVPIAVLRGPELIFDIANPAYRQVVGDRDIRGKPLLEALPETRGQGFDELLHGVMRTGVTEIRHESLLRLERHAGLPEDTYWTFIYAPLRNLSGTIDSVIVICNEVTEQVRTRWALELLTDKLTDELTARTHAEVALRENERRLGLALSAGKFGSWELDLGDLNLITSQQCKANFGRAADAPFTYAMFRDAIHPDDRKHVAEAIDSATQAVGDYEAEYRCIWPDGSIHWISAKGLVLSEGDRPAARMVGMTQDITARKHAEEALNASKASLALALQAGKAGTFEWDIQRDVNSWSPELEALYDVASGTFEGNYQAWTSRIEPEDERAIDAGMRAVLDAQGRDYAYEFRAILPNGTRRWLAGRARFDYDTGGAPLRMFGLNIDIHERKQAELNAQFLLDLDACVNSLSDPGEIEQAVVGHLGAYMNLTRCYFGHIDADQVTVHHEWRADEHSALATHQLRDYFSPKAVEQFRANIATVVDDVTTDARTAEAAAQHQALGIGAFVTVPIVHQNAWVGALNIVSGHPRTWHTDEVQFLREVAARNWPLLEQARGRMALHASEARLQVLYTQEQAARAQAEEANRLKDDFLATVSHELRTPLTAFLGYAQLLRSRKRDDPYVLRTVEKMVRSAQDQAQIIEDLLDVSRIVSGKLRINLQPIELADVIVSALDTVRPTVEAKKIHLDIDLPLAACMINGDTNRLQQIVWNLLSNAAKFTPPEGRILVRLQPRGRDAQLTISDTGQGIKPEFLPYVFDRFRQADSTSNRAHNGLGLGLSIVRHLVELHGGTVQVSSAGDNQGATFTVRLPLMGEQSALNTVNAADTADKLCPPALAGLRVLLIDDQRHILEMLHDILVPCGAIVRLASTAQEGLEAARAWRPDVLVSDIAMPVYDGYWLIRQLRALPAEEGGNIPAAALTAYVRVEEGVKVLGSGFQLYVPKPIEPTELRAVVARLSRMTLGE